MHQRLQVEDVFIHGVILTSPWIKLIHEPQQWKALSPKQQQQMQSQPQLLDTQYPFAPISYYHSPLTSLPAGAIQHHHPPMLGRADPLCHHTITVRTLCDVAAATELLASDSSKQQQQQPQQQLQSLSSPSDSAGSKTITLPLLIIHGTGDKIASYQHTLQFFNECASLDKVFLSYLSFLSFFLIFLSYLSFLNTF